MCKTKDLANKVVRLYIGLDLARLKTWSLRGAAAILDQGLFSSTNFIINILLARWLDIESYGAFAVAFAVLLFFAGFHSALILEPLSALGPARYQNELPRYFGSQIKLHVLICSALSLLLIAVAWGYMLWRPDDSLGMAFLGTALTFPLTMFLWLVRRFFYVLQHPSGALLGSGLYCLLCLGGVFFLHYIGEVSPFNGFIVLGLASLISSALVLISLRSPKARKIEFRALAMPSVLRAHWDYGRWFVGLAVLGLFINQAQIFLGAAFLGLEGAGVFRALQNPVLPMTQTVLAVSTFGIPILAAEFGRGNLWALHKKRFFITAALTVTVCIYEMALLFGDTHLERLLYGGKFASYAWVMPVLGLVPLCSALTTGYHVALRALQKPQYLFYLALATIPVSVLSTITFTWWWGIGGMASSMVLTYAFTWLLTIYIYRVMSSKMLAVRPPEIGHDFFRSEML